MPFDVDRWCRRHLGAPVVEVMSSGGHLSRVYGVRLADARTVAVKTRPASPRLDACAAVQRSLWRAGFPAPEPLAGPVVEDGVAVSAEALVPGGAAAPATEPARRFAALFARLVTLAPRPEAAGPLTPAPAWTAWDHDVPGIWAEGLWVSAYNTKKASLDGLPWLAQDEAERRLALTGT
ncbi:hypothetical protein [Dactylosporangium sp. NPDC000521]|uniref:hypothetical protein n=1 Tax=Dactylosporangium sp. NPDC000521 TaxID=3363975 RepID=UPI0036880153